MKSTCLGENKRTFEGSVKTESKNKFVVKIIKIEVEELDGDPEMPAMKRK